MTRWTATYTIEESPGYALIGNIPGTEEEAREYAEAQVGTDLDAWGYAFRLLELRAVAKEEETK